jgi:hypothetical protein
MRGTDDTGGRGTVVVVVGGRVVLVVLELLVVVGRVVVVVDVEVLVEVDVEVVVEVEVEVVELVVVLVDDVDVEVEVDDVGGGADTSWWTKASVCALVSSDTRLVAVETNPTHVPLALIAEPVECPSDWLPAESTLARVVTPVDRSCRRQRGWSRRIRRRPWCRRR